MRYVPNLLSLLMVVAASAQPVTAPVKPTQPYRDVLKLLAEVPAKLLPERGQQFTGVHLKQVSDWLNETMPGRPIDIPVVATNTTIQGKHGSLQGRFDDPNEQEQAMGVIIQRIDVDISIPENERQSLAKVKQGETVHPREGTIKSIRLSGPYGHEKTTSVIVQVNIDAVGVIKGK